jgi:hypothetical protein
MWSPWTAARIAEMVESSAKLTKRTVDAATPRPGRYIVWDTELKGFVLVELI